MNVFDAMPDLSWLEQLRALLASGQQPPIGTTLGFRLVSIAQGEAVFEGVPGPGRSTRWARSAAGMPPRC
jgi:hypothetical protein